MHRHTVLQEQLPSQGPAKGALQRRGSGYRQKVTHLLRELPTYPPSHPLTTLQGDVIESGFFADVAAVSPSSFPAVSCGLFGRLHSVSTSSAPKPQAPERQATVEVACALEGLVNCLQASLAQAASEHAGGGPAAAADSERHQLYADCTLVATQFLLAAQVCAWGPGSLGRFGVRHLPSQLRVGQGV